MPEAPEPRLPRRAEQVQLDGVGQVPADAAEVEGDRGRRLGLNTVQTVDGLALRGQVLLGPQRRDVADGGDGGGLADAEPSGHHQLHHRTLRALRVYRHAGHPAFAAASGNLSRSAAATACSICTSGP